MTTPYAQSTLGHTTLGTTRISKSPPNRGTSTPSSRGRQHTTEAIQQHRAEQQRGGDPHSRGDTSHQSWRDNTKGKEPHNSSGTHHVETYYALKGTTQRKEQEYLISGATQSSGAHSRQ